MRTPILCFALLLPLAAQPIRQRHITQGRATTVIDNLYKCPVEVANHRLAAVGAITAQDGTQITVPADTAFQHKLGTPAADVYNECTKKTAADSNIPIIEVDPNGEVITGYIVADNYFELYVNGKLIAVDNTPYTPFNSAVVKFKAKRPITYVFRVVDWEENLGLGSEMMRGNPFYPGDGGLIARFSDGTVTDKTWKAQSFYIAPLNDPKEVVEAPGNIHDSSALGRVHPKAKIPACQDKCFAIHYTYPTDWSRPKFNDATWPAAYEYTDEEIGVTNLPAYTKYPELFKGAQWIWTNNLVFDNVIIARKTVR
jgi:hypothetical protein